MSHYRLDTATCSYVMKRSNDALLKLLRRIPGPRRVHFRDHQVRAPVRVEVSARHQQDEAALHAFLRHVEVLDFPDAAGAPLCKYPCRPEDKGGHDLGAESVLLTIVN